MTKKLTPKQAAFVAEYLVDLNATEAAIRAGYSKKTAAVIGHENLRKPKIAETIQAAMQERAERNELTADEVLANLREVATGEANYEELNGFGILVKHVPAFRDRIRAWELLGKHLGMFTDKVDITSKGHSLTPPVTVYLPDNGRDDRE